MSPFFRESEQELVTLEFGEEVESDQFMENLASFKNGDLPLTMVEKFETKETAADSMSNVLDAIPKNRNFELILLNCECSSLLI